MEPIARRVFPHWSQKVADGSIIALQYGQRRVVRGVIKMFLATIRRHVESLHVCHMSTRMLYLSLPGSLPDISTFVLFHAGTAVMSGPTPAFSGAAGDLHRPARATAHHTPKKSRPGQGPRQRRPLQSNVGPHVTMLDLNLPLIPKSIHGFSLIYKICKVGAFQS